MNKFKNLCKSILGVAMTIALMPVILVVSVVYVAYIALTNKDM